MVGGVCYSPKFYMRSLCPEVQPLTLLNTTFGDPFLISSIDKWYPFHLGNLHPI